ncbi:uncharacterized protein LOC121857670 [Homarus americanus]|uniref:uncharacterized protein LOC121857670 n=1 Tax=Homarus americanus TaxID=6706 RepID=UPI001C49278D|nr:uncharacterized protein LOC121857670 [Homarus americanus]
MITRVRVPARLEVGGEGELDCSWEENTDHMYSIQWYQGPHEFYRYTPTAAHPIQIFDPPTLDVDVTNVTLAAEGPSTVKLRRWPDLPHCFRLCYSHCGRSTRRGASDQGREKSLPGGGLGRPHLYFPQIQASGRLAFAINTQPVSPGWLDPQTDQLDTDGLTTSSLRLRFLLLPRLLQEGEVRVRCGGRSPGCTSRRPTTSSPHTHPTTPPSWAVVLLQVHGPGTTFWPSPSLSWCHPSLFTRFSESASPTPPPPAIPSSSVNALIYEPKN